MDKFNLSNKIRDIPYLMITPSYGFKVIVPMFQAGLIQDGLIPEDRRNEDAQWKADFHAAMDSL